MVYFRHFPVYLVCGLLDLFQKLPTKIEANKPVCMRQAFNLIAMYPDFQVAFVQDAAYQEFVIDKPSANVKQAIISPLVKITKCTLVTAAKEQQVLLVACGRPREFMKCHSIDNNLDQQSK